MGLWKMENSLKDLGLTQEHSQEIKDLTVVIFILMVGKSIFSI